MEGLDIENILGADELDNLFVEDTETQETPPDEKEDFSTEKKDDKNNIDTTEVDVDSLFADPESVGSEEKNQEDGSTTDSNKDKGTSSKNNFYSSIAKALKEDDVLPDLDDETLSNIQNPEDFAEVIQKQIKAQFDERQQRIDNALNNGVETSEIKKYEGALGYLDSIQDDNISDESEKGETLRKQLIYQDFLNRGYSQERAQREVTKSFNAGTDLEDAKEALSSNKEFFKTEYDSLIREAEKATEEERLEREQTAEKLKKSILEDNKVFGELVVDKNTRKRIFDNISKPVYTDPKSGEMYTAIQKYEKENRTEFLKNVGLLFTLTDGFKNLDGLVKGKVNKEIKKGLRELENTINNTSRTSDGNLRFMSGVDDDPESFFSKGVELDV